MEPISEINSVHVSSLGNSYEKVSGHLRNHLGKYCGAVYALDDAHRRLLFQSECLVPNRIDNRIRILCLISNAHPESIRKGMFHFAESGVASLWHDLCAVGFLTADRGTLEHPRLLRQCCLNVAYPGPFALAFACIWLFPTPKPDQLVKLFGPLREPPGFTNTRERLNSLLGKWAPQAIISFNGEVFEELTGIPSKGYLQRITSDLFTGKYAPTESVSYKVFQTYPAAYRFHKKAEQLRRESLQRIKQEILSGFKFKTPT